MKVEINGSSYFIDWRHIKSEVKSLSKFRTACSIRDEALQLVATDLAECSLKDNFCRETGRKISLTRAIRVFDKSVRKQIWEAYFNRSKNGTNN